MSNPCSSGRLLHRLEAVGSNPNSQNRYNFQYCNFKCYNFQCYNFQCYNFQCYNSQCYNFQYTYKHPDLHKSSVTFSGSLCYSNFALIQFVNYLSAIS